MHPPPRLFDSPSQIDHSAPHNAARGARGAKKNSFASAFMFINHFSILFRGSKFAILQNIWLQINTTDTGGVGLHKQWAGLGKLGWGHGHSAQPL